MEHNRIVYEKPYDAEVEYLESTGTQWLDTGYYGDINTAMECVCKVTDTTYGYVIAGSRTSATNDNISFLCGIYPSYYQYMCDFGDYTNSRLSVKESDVNDYVKLYTSANLRKAVDVVNETEYTNNYVISSTLQTPYTIKICHHDGNYSASYKHFRGRIKSFKLWSSDTLLLDFIPVRVGSIGYMYDKVSKKLFGNKGTGNFILGQDVANPVPNIRRVFRFGNKRFVMPMPYDRRVEYLESDGNQYINTDMIVKGNYTISIKANIAANNTAECLWCSRANFKENTFTLSKISNSYIRFDYNTTQKEITFSDYNKIHIYKAIGGKLYIDNVLKFTITQSNFTTGGNLLVFATTTKNNSPNIITTGKIYGFIIIDNNGVTLIDLIPVRKNGIGYMYDKVSGKLFGNAGTGQFILGNDIND